MAQQRLKARLRESLEDTTVGGKGKLVQPEWVEMGSLGHGQTFCEPGRGRSKHACSIVADSQMQVRDTDRHLRC